MEEQNYILQNYEAMGTVWYIEVFEAMPEAKKNELQNLVMEYIQDFEHKYSRFRKDSLLTELNTTRHIAYDKGMAEMITEGERVRALTDGVFTLFILKKLTDKGYGESLTQGTDSESLSESQVVITDTEIVLKGSQSIDLGGIGKGYLIDRLKELLESHNITQLLINGGGDMYVTHKDNQLITVYMQHPKNHDEYIGTLNLKNQSFCSSSSYMRAWNREGKDMNHFITKDGSEIWAASYVVGDTATQADVAATVLTLSANDEKKLQHYGQTFEVEYLVIRDTNEMLGDLSYVPAL